nr:hypothetical protein CFP56_00910 [Quercus suber]
MIRSLEGRTRHRNSTAQPSSSFEPIRVKILRLSEISPVAHKKLGKSKHSTARLSSVRRKQKGHLNMHHLHPRSRTTSTLFTTTLAISFLVVALPHILPCPVDRRQFADTIEMPDGTIRHRKQRKQVSAATEDLDGNSETSMAAARPPRECPVPKPTGLVGQLMGLAGQENKEKPKEIIVQSLQKRRTSLRRENAETETP